MTEETYPQVVLFGSIYPDWRESHIIPVLEELGVTYYNPVSPDGWWNKDLGDREAIFMAHCDTIIMVFTKDLPSFTSLAEAGWAALGAQVRGQHFIMYIDHEIEFKLPESMKDSLDYEKVNRQLQHWATSSRYLTEKHAAQFNIPSMKIASSLEDVAKILREIYSK